MSSAAYAYYMDPAMPNFSQKKWDKIIEGFQKKYCGLMQWHDNIVAEVRRNGQLIGPTGRIWKFHKEQKRGGYQDYSVAKVYNYPVQGTSGDIIKLAMVIANKRRMKAGLIKSLPVMVVHDSYVWDCPEDEVQPLAEIIIQTFRDIPQLTQKYFGFEINCPITGEADAGLSWGHMTQLTI